MRTRVSAQDEDEAIVRSLATGDPHAPARLIRRKLPRLLALAERLLGDAAEAEDVAQEVLARACRQARIWRPGAAKFDVWMHALAVRQCRRRVSERRERPTASPPDREDPGPLAEDALLDAERRTSVRRAVLDLPVRQREALVLCHYQELSNIDAALAMGVSVEALESLLARGRRTLKTALFELR